MFLKTPLSAPSASLPASACLYDALSKMLPAGCRAGFRAVFESGVAALTLMLFDRNSFSVNHMFAYVMSLLCGGKRHQSILRSSSMKPLDRVSADGV